MFSSPFLLCVSVLKRVVHQQTLGRGPFFNTETERRKGRERGMVSYG